MAQRNVFRTGGKTSRDGSGSDGAPDDVPLGGTRAEAVQRLQIGLFGVGAMLLLVGLASIIGSQADLTEERAVPEAAPTTEPTAAPQQSDPLADAGVVPDIQADPGPSPSPRPLQLPPPNGGTNSPANGAPGQ